MNELISRNFLHPDIEFHDHQAGICYYHEFVDSITYWKSILYEEYGLRRGNKVVIYITSLRFDYVCLVLAAAELGLKLILTPEKPNSMDGRDAKLDALVKEHGLIDLAILDDLCWDMPAILASANRYSKQVIKSSIFLSYEIKNHSVYEQMKNTVYANELDELVITTTSGSTGEPKLIVYTHQQMYRIGKRNARAYDYENKSTCHTRNMHHAFVLLCHFLPSLTSVKIHFTHSFNNNNNESILSLFQTLESKKVDNVVLSYKSMLDDLIKFMIDNQLRFNHKITFIVGGFYITKDYIEKLQKTNVECIISTFGSNETLAPILLRHTYKDINPENYQPNFLGHPCDDYYQLSVTDDRQLKVECKELFESPIIMDDSFEGNSIDGYYHLGRENFYRIDHRDFSLQQVNSIIEKFVDGDFSVSIDLPFQRLYLALWGNYTLKDFTQLNQTLKDNIGVMLSDFARLDKVEYSDFKLNHDKLRSYFRKKGNLQ